MTQPCAWMRDKAFVASEELAVEERDEIARHLASCPTCRAEHQWSADVLAVVSEAVASHDEPATKDRILGVLQPTMVASAERQARRARRTRWLRPLTWTLVPVTGVALALLVVLRVTQAPQGEPPLLARVLVATDGSLPDSHARTVVQGEWLRTTDHGQIDLETQQSWISMQPATRAVLSTLSATTTRVSLARGTILLASRGDHVDRHLFVHAEFAQLEALGTQFSVSTDQGGTVAVYEGSVRVEPTGPRAKGFVLEAGNLWLAVTGARRALSDAEQVGLTWGFAGHDPSEAAGGFAIEPTAPTPRVVAKSSRVKPPRLDKSTDVAADIVTAARSSNCERAQSLVDKAGAGLGDRRAELLSMLAQCFQVQGNRERALTLYQHVARRYRGTPVAENALFEAARLLAQLGRSKASLAALQDYTRAYPRGALLGDVKLRICQLQLEAQRLGDALSCVREYRRKHATGQRVGEALLLEATILRQTRFYAEAATTYAAYLEKADPARAEEALYWRVFCLQRSGDREGMRRAGAGYLARFPQGAHLAEVQRWMAQ